MNWFHLKLCLILVFTSYFVAAEHDHTSNFHEEELMPTDHLINSNNAPIVQKKVVTRGSDKFLKPSLVPNLNRNIAPGFQLVPGLLQAPFLMPPLDAQPSNKVLLVLNNDKNKFVDFMNPAGESLRRITRDPGVMDDIVGQAQNLGGGLTGQIFSQLTQTAPEMSRSFGQAMNEMLAQTSLLAQNAPGNLDLSQLGQSLSQSFLNGAQLLNPSANQASSDSSAGASQTAQSAGDVSQNAADSQVGDALDADTADAGADADTADAASTPEAPKNPFEQIVGSSLLNGLSLPQLGQLPQLSQLPGLNLFNLPGLTPLGSEISEIHVMPDQYSPYKISPKEVDHQTLAEMKLKAVLKEALNKKTIPILWFHVHNNHQHQKSYEDLEMEAKLEIFEKKVIEELKQLQDLSKLANDVKKTQIESGAKPTTSLTTQLNLYEIPIYDITLGDIEKTLKDEHVIMLMKTIVQKQNKEYHKHHQASTKYLTDLMGTPIKRQTKTAEDALKSMEKDDMLKMMTYAYRMAAKNGDEMPWIKNAKIEGLADNADKKTMADQQRQSAEGSNPMASERQWLEEKQREMAAEAEKQKQADSQNQMRQWADASMPNMQQPQPIERQWANPEMRQQQMPMEMQKDMMTPQHQMPKPHRKLSPHVLKTNLDTSMQRQLANSESEQHTQAMMQRQWIDSNMQKQAAEREAAQRQWIDSNMQQQAAQRQWFDANMQKQANEQQAAQRQWIETNEQMQRQAAEQAAQRQAAEQQQQMQRQAAEQQQQQMQRQAAEQQQQMQRQAAEQQQQMAQRQSAEQAAQRQTPEQRQWIDSNANEQMPAKTHNPMMTQQRSDDTSMVGEAKPQMPENAGQARHKVEDLFDEMDLFGSKKKKPQQPPTIINYYYSSGGSRYPPVYSAPQPPQAYAPAGGYGGYARPPPPAPASMAYGYAKPLPPPPPPSAYGGSYGPYRSAIGDEEISNMLQQNQQMPKMMMPQNEDPKTASPIFMTDNFIATPDNHPTKRLAKGYTQSSMVSNPAAYVLVIRNQASKSSSNRSRSKRSTEYATLEPIDERSLNDLRKTYKDSLKEITLNPDETPAEALMRYNAEAIREALEKANQKPMEITAGDEEEEVGHEEAKDSKTANTQNYSPNQNGQYVSLTGIQPYMTLPVSVPQTASLAMSLNQPDANMVYDPSFNSEGLYNNVISKYNNPLSFNTNKIVSTNPYLPMYNSLESVPFVEDYNTANQPYTLVNSDALNGPAKSSKSSMYQNPFVQPFLTNSINKNPSEIYTSGFQTTDYGRSKTLSPYEDFAYQQFSNSINKPGNLDKYGLSRFPQAATDFKSVQIPENMSFENLMTVIKERLAQCCDTCKENVMKSIEDTLRPKFYGSSTKPNLFQKNNKPYGMITERSHTVIYRNPNKQEEDREYQQWLGEMSEKGYDRSYLTKEHQQHYLKDGKPNLHVIQQKDHQDENIFYKDNYSQKREIIPPEMKDKVEKGKEKVTENVTENVTEKVLNSIEVENDHEKNQEFEEGEDEELEEEKEEVEEEVELEAEEEIEAEEEMETETETPATPKETNKKKANNKIEKETKLEKDKAKEDNKVITPKEKSPSLNSNKTLETAETTTHSVYALRGQFHTTKRNPRPFSLKPVGKQFSNYKNLNKFGSNANSISKSDDDNKNSLDKNDKLEKILDILQDLSQQKKETSKEVLTKTTSSPETTDKPMQSTKLNNVITSSTMKPSTTLSPQILKAATTGSTEKPKKLSRRRIRLSSKSRKFAKSSTESPNDIKLDASN